MSLPLDELRYLEALERLGSAAAAGRELGVATSTVYRKIGALEDALGLVCLSRGGGVTEVGRELADVARRARDSLGEVVRRSQKDASELEGSVSLTTVAGFVPLLAPALAELARRHPELRIDLHVGDDGPSVRDREVDIAISVIPEPPPQLVGRRVMTIRYDAYRVDACDPSARWIVLGPPMHATPQASWESANVPREKIAIATGSRAAFLEMVRAGIGIGVLPRPLASRYPELRSLEEYRAELAHLDRPAWLLTHPELRGVAKIGAVIDVLGAALENERE
jgi:DNA-binding transcriptional LysR family regulator